jgi:hypothetical protein
MMNIMRRSKCIFSLFFVFLAFSLSAQVPEPDKSPLDFSYAPANYPILKFQGRHKTSLPLARVMYSRPQKNGRDLFGKEIKFGEIWRLGANETTEIEFFRSVTIGGRTIGKGRYSLYCIPSADKWVLIINKDLFTWGAFSYKQTSDVARISLPVVNQPGVNVEYFTMYFNESNHLVMQWDDVKVIAPFAFAAR